MMDLVGTNGLEVFKTGHETSLGRVKHINVKTDFVYVVMDNDKCSMFNMSYIKSLVCVPAKNIRHASI